MKFVAFAASMLLAVAPPSIVLDDKTQARWARGPA
jgi:hypothetical protein